MSCFSGLSPQNKSIENKGSSMAAHYEQEYPPCKFSLKKNKKNHRNRLARLRFSLNIFQFLFFTGSDRRQITILDSVATNKKSLKNTKAKSFTFRELATATNSFRQEFLIGEGGYGRVFKGKIEKTGQVKRK